MLIKTALFLYFTAQKRKQKRNARVPQIAMDYKLQQNNILSSIKSI